MNTYLASHQSKDKSECTHTRIGSPEHHVFGGSYHIDNLPEFYALYYQDVIVKGTAEHLTEKQLECGPLGIDLDFRYPEPKRQYTKDHIGDLVDVLVEELHKMFVIDESFPIYVFEKQNINVKKDVIKDGIHMIVGMNLESVAKGMLRDRLLKKMSIWEDMTLVNDWDSVLDENVFKGLTAWQLYGSRKPGHEAYQFTMMYQCGTQIEERSVTGFPMETDFHKLTVRNTNHEIPLLKEEYKAEFERGKQRKRTRVAQGAAPTEWNAATVTSGLEQLFSTLTVSEYVVQEAHLYVMCLPKVYCDDYGKWIRVGWALKNTDPRLFLSWVKFSSQSEKFNYSDIPTHQKMWDSWRPNQEMLTLRSIMYWVRTENQDEYDKIKEKSVDVALEEAIREITCTELDIANILFQLYKDLFVCVDIKSARWFQYVHPKWEETDSGTELRKQLTNIKGLYGIFAKKLAQVGQLMSSMTPDDERFAPIKKKHGKIAGIMTNILKKQGNKIMTEAAHTFYVKNFLQLLDSKNDLLCFNNGIIDFSLNAFRQGLPEDYTSKCTQIPYVPFGELAPDVVEEVKGFMEQLFPDEELRNYMWDHAASVLIGKNCNQTFNIYIGEGRNGKSKFVELMSAVLGDYKATVPISLITKERTGIGSVSPEVANLVGIRYAVMQESSVRDKINEGPMKELTGGDQIQCRGLYKSPITFIPQFKLTMATNNLPGMDGKDEGTWRRIRACEFKSKFVENPNTDSKYEFKVDKNLDNKFESWKTVFMSLLVERAYVTKGNVVDCKMVLVNSEKYRKDQDYLAAFASSHIRIDPSGRIRETELYEAFTDWYKTYHGKQLPKGKELFEYITKSYANVPGISKKMNAWHGLSIISPEVDDLI